ncbi:MAG: hypothetical protein GXO86_01890 [Chlorobi bacterium]|nr:hypothetical protein [Chlorobiota bacterium]
MNSRKAKIKEYLIKLISETEDENILNEVKAYFTLLKNKKTDWWDTISVQEKDAIEIGLQQLEKGEKIPHEKVKQKADELLGKK